MKPEEEGGTGVSIEDIQGVTVTPVFNDGDWFIMERHFDEASSIAKNMKNYSWLWDKHPLNTYKLNHKHGAYRYAVIIGDGCIQCNAHPPDTIIGLIRMMNWRN